ncbi:hypothetical protein [Clostridium brassicae]|uniref:Uncharacterized protein n=1 Tax=Clostridium brassicae TaxID=2999072 RepID=A0ABT4DB38_9CLOT|nr:hypothetical protein [Clostridium brassicae]MCY6958351.1 hypothetical protein [Clostridium brassicae]
MFENAEKVIEGTWVYAGNVTCNLWIIKWDVLYGTGDYEDPPKIENDKESECYYVEFESMVEKGRVTSVRGGFLTLSDAIKDAEKAVNQKINWVK